MFLCYCHLSAFQIALKQKESHFLFYIHTKTIIVNALYLKETRQWAQISVLSQKNFFLATSIFKIGQYRNRCYPTVSHPDRRKHHYSNPIYLLLNTKAPSHLRKINYSVDGGKIPAVIKHKVILMSLAMWSNERNEQPAQKSGAPLCSARAGSSGMDFMFRRGGPGGLWLGPRGLCMGGSWCLIFIYVKVTMAADSDA